MARRVNENVVMCMPCGSARLGGVKSVLVGSRQRLPTLPAVSRATSGTFRRADAQRLGKQWPRAASGDEALQDLLASPIGEPERDPAIEIDPLKHNRERRVAFRPARIGQILLRRVRDGARPQEEGAPARPDDRIQCPEESAALI